MDLKIWLFCAREKTFCVIFKLHRITTLTVRYLETCLHRAAFSSQVPSPSEVAGSGFFFLLRNQNKEKLFFFLLVRETFREFPSAVWRWLLLLVIKKSPILILNMRARIDFGAWRYDDVGHQMSWVHVCDNTPVRNTVSVFWLIFMFISHVSSGSNRFLWSYFLSLLNANTFLWQYYLTCLTFNYKITPLPLSSIKSSRILS